MQIIMRLYIGLWNQFPTRWFCYWLKIEISALNRILAQKSYLGSKSNFLKSLIGSKIVYRVKKYFGSKSNFLKSYIGSKTSFLINHSISKTNDFIIKKYIWEIFVLLWNVSKWPLSILNKYQSALRAFVGDHFSIFEEINIENFDAKVKIFAKCQIRGNFNPSHVEASFFLFPHRGLIWPNLIRNVWKEKLKLFLSQSHWLTSW